ncbi:MAG: hypothetical protein WC835_03665 [Candidatus Paceibacterota bacterium]|jgi:hypothetical protein
MSDLSKKTVPAAIGIMAIILVAGTILYWGTALPSFDLKNQTASVINSQLSQPSAQTQSPHETITAKHQYKNGNHIVAGEANLPTPCHTLVTNPEVVGSSPEQVTINFISTTNSDVCAQTVTTARFKVNFKASEQAVIKATWNGQPVALNLIPVSADEDLNDFQIYMKG